MVLASDDVYLLVLDRNNGRATVLRATGGAWVRLLAFRASVAGLCPRIMLSCPDGGSACHHIPL